MAWLLLWAGLASAAELTSIRQLDVGNLLALADQHPQIQMSDAQVDSAVARQRRAVMTPVSGLTIGSGVALNNDAISGTGPGALDPMFQMNGQLWFGVDVIEVATYGTRVKQARAEHKEMIALRESRRREIHAEVRGLLARIAAQEDALAAMERNLAQLEDSHRIAQEDFVAGSISAGQLSTISQMTTNATVQLANSRALVAEMVAMLEGLIGVPLAEAMEEP